MTTNPLPISVVAVVVAVYGGIPPAIPTVSVLPTSPVTEEALSIKGADVVIT